MGTTLQREIGCRYGTEILAKGDLAAADELFAANIIDHHPLPGQAPGREGIKQAMIVYRAAFPDLAVTIDDIIAEDDKVVLRWTAYGTYRGGLPGVLASGHPAATSGIEILQIAGGRIVERWTEVGSFSVRT